MLYQGHILDSFSFPIYQIRSQLGSRLKLRIFLKSI